MDEQGKLDRRCVLELTASALEGLPIIERMRFVQDLLAGYGGELGSTPHIPAIALGVEVLKGVIEVLESRPRVAKLRDSRPRVAKLRGPAPG
jgi:hypothetical protein